MAFGSGRKNPKNWRLYHLLELEPPVTARQVQWTFRKVTLRHHFYQAYLVLYNEERKSLYDALGEDAVDFIHSGSWGPLIYLLGARGSIKLYSLLMLMAFALLAIFFVLLGLRDDSFITWPWMYVNIPLFILLVNGMVVTTAAAVVSLFWRATWEEGMHWVERIPALGNFIAMLCYTIFAFLVTAEVDDDSQSAAQNLLNNLGLLIGGDLVYYLASLVWRWPRRVRLSMEVGLNRPNRLLCYGLALTAVAHMGLSTLQWVLLGLKVNRGIRISWYVTFIPFCLRAAIRILEAFICSMSRRTIGVKTDSAVVFDTLGAFFFNGMLLVSLYFSAVRITRGREEVELALALIPVFLVLAYLMFSMIVTLIYLLSKDTENRREERLNNLKWVPTDSPGDDRSGPLIFHDIDGAAANWDEINDRSPSRFSGNKGEVGLDDYEDFDSNVEEVFPVSSPHAQNAPFGVFAPPNDFPRPYLSSRAPSLAQGTEAERPPERQLHHDPYDPKTDAARATRFSGTPISGEEDEEDSGEEGYYDEDDQEDSMVSSSIVSSTFLTPTVNSPRN